MAFSPDGAILATLSAEDYSLRLWDPATGKRLSVVEMSLISFSWSPDGEYLAAASLGGVVKIWKVSELLGR